MGLLALLSVLPLLQEQWDQKLSGGGKAAGAAHAAGAGADGQSVCPRTRLPAAGPVLAATAAAPRQGNSRGRGAGRGRENPTDKEGKRKRKGENNAVQGLEGRGEKEKGPSMLIKPLLHYIT